MLTCLIICNSSAKKKKIVEQLSYSGGQLKPFFSELAYLRLSVTNIEKKNLSSFHFIV